MCFLRFLFNWKMVRMNFIFILPIKMAILHQVVSLGGGGGGGGFNQPGWSRKDKKKKNIIELQYCTGMSRRKIKK